MEFKNNNKCFKDKRNFFQHSYITYFNFKSIFNNKYSKLEIDIARIPYMNFHFLTGMGNNTIIVLINAIVAVVIILLL